MIPMMNNRKEAILRISSNSNGNKKQNSKTRKTPWNGSFLGSKVKDDDSKANKTLTDASNALKPHDTKVASNRCTVEPREGKDAVEIPNSLAVKAKAKIATVTASTLHHGESSPRAKALSAPVQHGVQSPPPPPPSSRRGFGRRGRGVVSRAGKDPERIVNEKSQQAAPGPFRLETALKERRSHAPVRGRSPSTRRDGAAKDRSIGRGEQHSSKAAQQGKSPTPVLEPAVKPKSRRQGRRATPLADRTNSKSLVVKPPARSVVSVAKKDSPQDVPIPISFNPQQILYSNTTGLKLTVIDWDLKVFAIDMVSPRTCDFIRQLTSNHVRNVEAAGQLSWRTLYTYTKMDIPCIEVPGVGPIMDRVMYTTVQTLGDIYRTLDVSNLRRRSWKEPHLLMYQKVQGKSYVDLLHCEISLLFVH